MLHTDTENPGPKTHSLIRNQVTTEQFAMGGCIASPIMYAIHWLMFMPLYVTVAACTHTDTGTPNNAHHWQSGAVREGEMALETK